MATTIQNSYRKKITSDTLTEIAQEATSLGAGDKFNITRLANGKYFTSIESDNPVVNPVFQFKKITENGTFYPDAGYDGFNCIEVEVPEATEPRLKKITITENGIYDPPEGYDGFSKIIVNVGAAPVHDSHNSHASSYNPPHDNHESHASYMTPHANHQSHASYMDPHTNHVSHASSSPSTHASHASYADMHDNHSSHASSSPTTHASHTNTTNPGGHEEWDDEL